MLLSAKPGDGIAQSNVSLKRRREEEEEEREVGSSERHYGWGNRIYHRF
jgi:hypothetical protein